MAFNWTCPHCNRPQTVTEQRVCTVTNSVGVKAAEGSLVYKATSISCANPDCSKLTFALVIGQDDEKLSQGWNLKHGTEIFAETLLPRGAAKPQPDYIPIALREDYYEACLIKDLSPKASATLTRRCLQGMIRNFCGISRKRLVDEINSLKSAVEDGSADRAVTSETVAAIDHVRSVGNIGAHMESDIDVIVAVDPGEAQAMIELIEMLFDEWYGARERRAQKLAEIEKIKLAKDNLKHAAKVSEESAPAEIEVVAQMGAGEAAE